MKKIKVLLIFLLVVSTLTMSGCWNYRDIDEFAIVSGTAIDKGVDGKRYHMTFEIADISNGSESPVKPKIIESEGDSIFEAVRNAGLRSADRLYFSHCNLFVISRELSQEGIIPIINWMNRDAVMRLKSNIVVSNMDTAKEILLSSPTSENLVSNEISNMIKTDNKYLSKSPQTWLYYASDMIDTEGIDLIIPSLKTTDQTASQGQESGESGEGNKDEDKSKNQEKGTKKDAKSTGKNKVTIPVLDGTAVFKKDKLVGFLSSDETQYILAIKGDIKGGPLFVNKNMSGNGATLNIIEANSEITPEIIGDKIKFKTKINIKASLAEDETNTTHNNDEAIEQLEKSADEQLKESISAVVKRLQNQYSCDIFGYGEKLSQQKPDEWASLKENWDTTFKNAEIEIEPSVKIVNTAVEKEKVGNKK